MLPNSARMCSRGRKPGETWRLLESVARHTVFKELIIIPKREITGTAQFSYILEHFTSMKRAMNAMNKAFHDDDAEKFIDALGNLQWHEKSVIVGSKRLMRERGFSEANLQIRPLMEYADDNE